MKTMIFILASVLIFFSCKKEKKESMPVEKIYLVTYFPMQPDYQESIWDVEGMDMCSLYREHIKIHSYIEIRNDYSINIIKKESEYLNLTLPSNADLFTTGALKDIANRIIDTYPTDTIIYDLDRAPDLYSGPSYMILIKTNEGKCIYVIGTPYLSDVEDIHSLWSLLREETYFYDRVALANQDSVKQIFGFLKSEMPMEFIRSLFPPPPLKGYSIQFIPPVIN